MNLMLIGLSHHTAPLDVRERLVFDAASLPRALERLSELLQPGAELILLSTCNRTEVLLRGGGPGAREAVNRFLLEKSGLEPVRLSRLLYLMEEVEAVRHLYRVASSLDSMVIGEPQIQHQVKEAHAVAVREGRAGAILDGLCQRAFQAAKRVRTETAIGRQPVSISYAAARLAGTIFGDLASCSVLVLGAGEMSELTARHLADSGAREIVVTTRRYERGQELARRVGGEAVPFTELHAVLERVDIVLASTAAPHTLLNRDDVARLMQARRQRPIFFIDIAVPRDVDPAVNELDNVYLYDLDDLQHVVDGNLEQRRAEAASAERIIEAEVERSQRWMRSLVAGPTIASLRSALHDLRAAELKRVLPKLESQREREMVESFSRQLVNRILHLPTTELKRWADAGADSRLDLVRRLFGLDAEAAASGEGVPLRLVRGPRRGQGS